MKIVTYANFFFFIIYPHVCVRAHVRVCVQGL